MCNVKMPSDTSLKLSNAASLQKLSTSGSNQNLSGDLSRAAGASCRELCSGTLWPPGEWDHLNSKQCKSKNENDKNYPQRKAGAQVALPSELNQTFKELVPTLHQLFRNRKEYSQLIL